MSNKYMRGPDGLLINTDYSDYIRYRKEVEEAKKMNEIENEMNDLKSDLSDIKNLLHQVLTNQGK